MTDKYSYKPLTPKLIKETDKNYDKYLVYRDALNQAYDNDEVSNIAITGIYGSGKSSLWKTYCNEKQKTKHDFWKKESVITVALSEFKEDTTDKQPVTLTEKKEYKKKINNVEEQIINQILYQVDSSKIPLSKYKIKGTAKEGVGFCSIVGIISILFGIFIFLKSAEISNHLPQTWPAWKDLALFLIGILLTIIPILFIAKRIIDKYEFHLSKISFNGNSVDLKDNQKDILNDEMRELVYIISSSEVHTVVFEDLDRFDNLDLFTKLRELNYLVNARLSKTVRFIYLLRDDLFLHQERTKFFDLIIPVIPVINSQNSRGIFLDLFNSEVEKTIRPNDWVIESLSLYIDDLRLLNSIRNEYEVYSKAIDVNNRNLNPNTLLGIVAFKNVFPKEFDLFQQDKGYVYQLIQNVEENRTKLIENFKNKIAEKIQTIDNLRVMTANSKYELMAQNIPSSLRFNKNGENILWAEFLKSWSENPDQTFPMYYPDGSQPSPNYKQFVEKFFSDEKYLRKEKRFKDAEKAESIKQYDKELKELEDKLNKIYTKPISEILSELSSEELKNFFIIKEDSEEKQYNESMEINYSLPFDHYFGLIRFIFYEGLLDETYKDYLGYFYQSTIGLNDEIFIRKLRDGSADDEYFELDNPSEVKNKLEEKDYKKIGIYNQSLIKAILNDDKDKTHFTEITRVTLQNDSKSNSLLAFMDSFDDNDIERSVNLLLSNDFDLYMKLINQSLSFENLHDRLLVKAFQNINLLKSDHSKIKQLREYTNTRSNLLLKTELINNEKFYKGAQEAHIRFDGIKDLDLDPIVAKELEEKELFWTSIQNIATIISIINNQSFKKSMIELLHLIDTDVSLKVTKEGMTEGIDIYVNRYLDEMDKFEESPNSNEETFARILNFNIEPETRIRLIEVEKSVISNLEVVKTKELWGSLLAHNKVNFTQNNVNQYYEYAGIDDALVEFLNENSKNKVITEVSIELANKLVLNEKINDDVFEVVLNKSDSKFDKINSLMIKKNEGSRVRALVNNSRLNLTKENYLSIQSLNSESCLLQYLKNNQEELDPFIGRVAILGSDVKDSEFNLILNHRLISVERSKVLLDHIKKKISLFDIPNAYPEIRNHVFDLYLADEDYQRMINNTKDFDLWDKFIAKINQNFQTILNLNLTKDFITRAMKDPNLLENLKVNLMMKIIEDKKYAENWESWFTNSQSEKLSILGKLFRKETRPNYPVAPSIKKLVDKLIEIDVISHSEKDGKISFKSTELKKLI